MSDTQIRRIPDRLDNWLRSAIFSWQSLLLLVAIAIFVANSFATPYFLNPWSISDSTFNFTEKALIALAMALVIISGEIDLSVAAIIRVLLNDDGFCSAIWSWDPWPCCHRHYHWLTVWRLQRRAGFRPAPAFHRCYNRHDELFSGPLLHCPRRSGFQRISFEFCLFRPGLCLVGGVIRSRPVPDHGCHLLFRATPHHLWPSDIRYWQQSCYCRILRCQGTPGQIPTVLPHGCDVRPRRRLVDFSPRLYPSFNSNRLGTRSHHHGRTWWCEHPWRRGQYYWCRFGGPDYGPCNVWAWPVECTRHCHVHRHRCASDRGHCLADPRGSPARQNGTVMKKFAFKMQINPGQRDEYKQRHDEIWPKLLEALSEAGVSDYSIHLDPDTNILFATMWRREDHGLDVLSQTDLMQKWWAYMADIMLTHDSNEPIVTPLETLFHMR